MERLTNIIEAILFASGRAVTTDDLREKLNTTKAKLDSAIHQLEKKYTGDCGIQLLYFNHKVQLATNPEYKAEISSVLTPIREKEFTRTILECAAIIAYKQPITRSEIEELRGVNSDYALTTLQSLEMIEPCGRKDSPGKPILFATTDNFLKRFKLKSLSELPDYNELMNRIAEMNSVSSVDDGAYLYQKDEYDPTSDNSMPDSNDLSSKPSEDAVLSHENENGVVEEPSVDGDTMEEAQDKISVFLDGMQEDIKKIQ